MVLLTELVALCLYGPALVLLHEAGHALFARAGGYRVTSFGIGLGKPIWSVYVRDGVVVHLDRWFLFGGACTAIPVGAPGPKRAWFHSGGLLLQAGLALCLLLAPDLWLIDRIANFNLLVAATNAIPWRTATQASDGWHIVDALRGGRRMGHVLGQRALLQRMLQQELAISSPVGVAYCDVCLAWSDVQLGLLDQAEERVVEAGPQTTREPWVEALWHVVLADWHRASGRHDEAILAAHQGHALEAIDPDARALLDLAEARAWVAAGQPDRAKDVLSRLLGIAGLAGNQAASTLLLAQADGSMVELEQATWRVERRILEGFLDPIDTIIALQMASEALEAGGRLQAARGAMDSSQNLLQRTIAQLPVRETAWVRARVQCGEGETPTATWPW